MIALVRDDRFDQPLGDLARFIVRHAAPHNFAAEAKALHKFVQNRIAFRRDPVQTEAIQSAYMTLRRMAGDCDDQSVLLATLAATVGIRSRFVIASYQIPFWHHVYAEMLLDGDQWIAAETTYERARFGESVAAVKKQVYDTFD